MPHITKVSITITVIFSNMATTFSQRERGEREGERQGREGRKGERQERETGEREGERERDGRERGRERERQGRERLILGSPRLPVRPLPEKEAQSLKLKLAVGSFRSMGSTLLTRLDDAEISIRATDSVLNNRIAGKIVRQVLCI